ncbi:hypothetical protein [Vibrio mimicus]|uniref:hypothetical protein n=1 Tax=Vibrio mimicus TaxID=674 RepID=UPI0001BACAA1|nr:hypothetical protein [Vibrio mimicus]EEY45334.1 hypothetical protein VMA_000729 [Vibrio mimicus VM223]EEY45364.1 hypothetical protein VMA_000759 [Vibrio mimicus VM223]
MDFIEKEKLKLDKGQFELKRRRLNWSQVAKPKTLDFCRSFAEQANKNGYPYHLFCYEGSKDRNAETIQFGIGINFTGIEKKEVQHLEDGGVIEKSTKVLEKGSALVFSQGPAGEIMILLYPYKSEVHSRSEDYIILRRGLLPEELTESLILHALRKSLYYARISSLNGIAYGFTLADRFSLYKMKYFDVRSKTKRREALVNLTSEWWKVIIASLLALAAALLVQNLGK